MPRLFAKTTVTLFMAKTFFCFHGWQAFLVESDRKQDEACLVPTGVLAKETRIPLGSIKNLSLTGPGVGLGSELLT